MKVCISSIVWERERSPYFIFVELSRQGIELGNMPRVRPYIVSTILVRNEFHLRRQTLKSKMNQVDQATIIDFLRPPHSLGCPTFLRVCCGLCCGLTAYSALWPWYVVYSLSDLSLSISRYYICPEFGVSNQVIKPIGQSTKTATINVCRATGTRLDRYL